MKSPAGKILQTNGQTPRAQKRKSGVMNTPVQKNNTPAKPANTPAKGKMPMTPNQKKKLLSTKKEIKEEEEEEVVEDVKMDDDESDDEPDVTDEEIEESDDDDDDSEEENDDEAEVNADEIGTVKKEKLGQAQRRKLAKRAKLARLADNPEAEVETGKRRKLVKDENEKPDTVILVKNCLTTTRKHQLSVQFAKYGSITAMWMKYQEKKVKAENQNRFPRVAGRTGLFYIRFQSIDEAEKAVEGENGKVFQGRHLSVEKLDGKTKNVKDCDADKTIYVNKIPSNIEEEDLWTFFGAYGEVANVRLLKSFKYNNHYAFVVFKTEKAAKAALKITPQTIGGAHILITKCEQEYVKPPKPALTPKSEPIQKTVTSAKPTPRKKSLPVQTNVPLQKKVKLTQKASAK